MARRRLAGRREQHRAFLEPGVDRDGAAQRLLPRLHPTLPYQDRRLAGQRREVAWFQRQRPLDVFQRAVWIVAQEADEGALVPALGIAGGIRDHAVENGERAGVVVGLALA